MSIPFISIQTILSLRPYSKLLKERTISLYKILRENMIFKVQYKNEVHAINITKLSIASLRQNILKQFSKVPPKFTIRVALPQGPIFDEQYLKSVSYQNVQKLKLYLCPRKNWEDLIELNSQNSFIELAQKQITQNASRIFTQLKQQNGVKPMATESQIQNYMNESLQQLAERVHIEGKAYDQSVIFEPLTNKSNVKSAQENMESQKVMKFEIRQPQQEDIPERKKQIVVDNIQCDRCFDFPIRGPIYKCLVCVNFDLCQACHQKYHNFHPLLRVCKSQHYPSNIKMFFPEKAGKYMKKELQKQEKHIKQEKRARLQVNSQPKVEYIDPQTLKQKKISSCNFLARVM